MWNIRGTHVGGDRERPSGQPPPGSRHTHRRAPSGLSSRPQASFVVWSAARDTHCHPWHPNPAWQVSREGSQTAHLQHCSPRLCLPSGAQVLPAGQVVSTCLPFPRPRSTWRPARAGTVPLPPESVLHVSRLQQARCLSLRLSLRLSACSEHTKNGEMQKKKEKRETPKNTSRAQTATHQVHTSRWKTPRLCREWKPSSAICVFWQLLTSAAQRGTAVGT